MASGLESDPTVAESSVTARSVDDPMGRLLDASTSSVADLVSSAADRAGALLAVAGLWDRAGERSGGTLAPIGQLLRELRQGLPLRQDASSWLGLFRTVAAPAAAAPDVLEPADLVLQHSPEDERFDVVGVVRTGQILTSVECSESGLDVHGSTRGQFVEVTTIGGEPVRKALQIVDLDGRLDRNTVVLRLGVQAARRDAPAPEQHRPVDRTQARRAK